MRIGKGVRFIIPSGQLYQKMNLTPFSFQFSRDVAGVLEHVMQEAEK